MWCAIAVPRVAFGWVASLRFLPSCSEWHPSGLVDFKDENALKQRWALQQTLEGKVSMLLKTVNPKSYMNRSCTECTEMERKRRSWKYSVIIGRGEKISTSDPLVPK